MVSLSYYNFDYISLTRLLIILLISTYHVHVKWQLEQIHICTKLYINCICDIQLILIRVLITL